MNYINEINNVKNHYQKQDKAKMNEETALKTYYLFEPCHQSRPKVVSNEPKTSIVNRDFDK
ncbi:1460_t:CDS:1, partial [Scutellospora calospora]